MLLEVVRLLPDLVPHSALPLLRTAGLVLLLRPLVRLLMPPTRSKLSPIVSDTLDGGGGGGGAVEWFFNRRFGGGDGGGKHKFVE